MKRARPLRIAILTHSTNPRGGVVHALAIAEALSQLRHEATVHAPDPKGAGFFRPVKCKTAVVPASPAGASLRDLVETRIRDYVRYFEEPARRRFDVYHAQDGISGNALAALKERGLIGAFARTVHHIEEFRDERVAFLQKRAIETPDRCFVVSRLWRDMLALDFDLQATLVGNGVDRDVFSSEPGPGDPELRQRLGLGPGPVFLAVGGVEERKNTLNTLRAFAQVLPAYPQAQLLIAGGVSLLDHNAYQAAFREEMARLPRARSRVVVAGAISQNDMPALYRTADALVFPSINEGFGLVAIEAIACGTPIVTSRIPPLIEHFSDGDVLWCDPFDAGSIAQAMKAAVEPGTRVRLRERAGTILAPHSWLSAARAHLPVYQELRELQYA
jgi:glycosyltransferase-like protein